MPDDPSGLEEGTHTQAKTHLTVESDAIYQELLEIFTPWSTQPAQVRVEVLTLTAGP